MHLPTLPVSTSSKKMTQPRFIVLDRLQTVQKDDAGAFTKTAVKVVTPEPCNQANAPGALRVFETLDNFREVARSSGAAFRRALSSKD